MRHSHRAPHVQWVAHDEKGLHVLTLRDCRGVCQVLPCCARDGLDEDVLRRHAAADSVVPRGFRERDGFFRHFPTGEDQLGDSTGFVQGDAVVDAVGESGGGLAVPSGQTEHDGRVGVSVGRAVENRNAPRRPACVDCQAYDGRKSSPECSFPHRRSRGARHTHSHPPCRGDALTGALRTETHGRQRNGSSRGHFCCATWSSRTLRPARRCLRTRSKSASCPGAPGGRDGESSRGPAAQSHERDAPS